MAVNLVTVTGNLEALIGGMPSLGLFWDHAFSHIESLSE